MGTIVGTMNVIKSEVWFEYVKLENYSLSCWVWVGILIHTSDVCIIPSLKKNGGVLIYKWYSKPCD